MSQESGRRVVTASMVAAPVRAPNPTSISAPGQREGPGAITDPAAIKATIATRVHANAKATTGSPNIATNHDDDLGFQQSTKCELMPNLKTEEALVLPELGFTT